MFFLTFHSFRYLWKDYLKLFDASGITRNNFGKHNLFPGESQNKWIYDIFPQFGLQIFSDGRWEKGVGVSWNIITSNQVLWCVVREVSCYKYYKSQDSWCNVIQTYTVTLSHCQLLKYNLMTTYNILDYTRLFTFYTVQKGPHFWRRKVEVTPWLRWSWPERVSFRG